MLPRGDYGVATCPSKNAETWRYGGPSHASVSPTGNIGRSPEMRGVLRALVFPRIGVLFRIEPTQHEVLPYFR